MADGMQLTPEEYLAFERRSEERNEYIDGRLVALSGAGRAHLLIVTNLTRELSAKLRGSGCEVYANEMRVKVTPSGRYVYPDIAVACNPQFEDATIDTLTTPTLIIEVLSDSTEAYDRGEKFIHYRMIDSLQEYVLISQRRMLGERFARHGKFWTVVPPCGPGDTLVLDSIGHELPLSEIYLDVKLPPAPVDDPARD